MPEGHRVRGKSDGVVDLELLSECEAACQKQSKDLIGRSFDLARVGAGSRPVPTFVLRLSVPFMSICPRNLF